MRVKFEYTKLTPCQGLIDMHGVLYVDNVDFIPVVGDAVYLSEKHLNPRNKHDNPKNMSTEYFEKLTDGVPEVVRRSWVVTGETELIIEIEVK